MEWLEGLGLFGLFIGTFIAATIFPFSSDALYIGILAATDNPLGCLLAGTAGNWLGSVLTYWIGWLGKWEWIEKWFKVKPETCQTKRENRQIRCLARTRGLGTVRWRHHCDSPRILQDCPILDNHPAAHRQVRQIPCMEPDVRPDINLHPLPYNATTDDSLPLLRR